MKNYRNLKAYRILAGYKQNEACKRLDISINRLCYYETGRSEPDIETLIRMSALYNVSIDTLVGNPLKVNDEPSKAEVIEKTGINVAEPTAYIGIGKKLRSEALSQLDKAIEEEKKIGKRLKKAKKK